MTERGQLNEIDVAVHALKCALRMDDLDSLQLNLKRLVKATEGQASCEAVTELIRRVECRIHEISDFGGPSMSSGNELIGDPLATQTDSDSKHENPEHKLKPSKMDSKQECSDTADIKKSDKCSIKSHRSVVSSRSGKRSGDEIRAEMEKAIIRKELLARQRQEEMRALRAQQEATQIALESKFRTQELKEEATLLENQIDLDLNEEQFLGSDEERVDKAEHVDRFSRNVQNDIPVIRPVTSREPYAAPLETSQHQGGHQQNVVGLGTETLSKLINKVTDNIIPTSEFSPKFDGSNDRHLFTNFMVRFETTYGSKESLSSTDKLLKLCDCTTGDARTIASRCILLGADGYKKALKKLKSRYGGIHYKWYNR